MKKIRIASRESQLALWQSNFIAKKIKEHFPNIETEVISFKTQGDIILDQPLATIGGKGLFIKELEQALLNNEADIAVHSMKDMPMDLMNDFTICAITDRENPTDAFISNNFKSLQELPEKSIIGTSSLRRQSQIKARFPNIQIKTLRGNLQTRLRKLDAGEYDAIILASAGLIRLNLAKRITDFIDIDFSIPAVGQGALGIETLKNNHQVQDLMQFLNHQDTMLCVNTERMVSRGLAGSCTVPLGAHANINDQSIYLKAFVAKPDGSKIIYSQKNGSINQHAEIAQAVVEDLKNQGAIEILN